MSDADDKTRTEESTEAAERARAKRKLTVSSVIILAVVVLSVVGAIGSPIISRNREQKKNRNKNKELCETMLEQCYGISKKTANVQVVGTLSTYFSFSFREQNRTYEGYVDHGVMMTDLYYEDLVQAVEDRTGDAFADMRARLESEKCKVYEPEVCVYEKLPAWITKEEIAKYMRGESEHPEAWEEVDISCNIAVVSQYDIKLGKEDFRTLREKIPFLDTLKIRCFRFESDRNRESDAYKIFTYNPKEDGLTTVTRPEKQ